MSVNIKYKNNSIAELSDTGTKTLKTAGKYCEDDISVEYTKPTGGGGATEPYVEEVYNTLNELISATLHGHKVIRSYGFYNSRNLTSINFPIGLTQIGNYAFSFCINLSLTSLPSGITSIGNDAFRYCTQLNITRLPSSLIDIYTTAFEGCTKLTSITFEGTPTSIASSAFKSCTNLTTINVPWAEGEVENAPWGATNATINYNYTGA